MLRIGRFFFLLAPFTVIPLASAQYPGSVPPPEDLARGFQSITVGRAKSILNFLAGPKCQGRGTGQPGFQTAADFVAEQFRKAGLKPMGDQGTYFQNQTFYRTYDVNAVIAEPTGKVILNKGFTINPTRRDVDVTAPVVIVRADDVKAKLSDADAAKLDGHIVIEMVPAGRSAIRQQVALASTQAVFMIDESDPVVGPAVRQSKGVGGNLAVSGRIAKRALRAIAPKAGDFLKAPLAAEKAVLMDTERTIHITAQTHTEPVQVPNVVGLLEGSDPVLKNEYVGVGGHLDHLGIVNGVVYPGADDDGSGSTAVMLIVNAMAKNPKKPRRSILFMTFCGEEMGLLGSGYLSDHPPVPLNKMVSELQMDMVARDSYGMQNNDPKRIDKEEENRDTVRLVGSKRISTELDAVIQKVNASVGFKFKYDAEDVYTRSDHYNFAKHGIPIAFLFDGFTPSYHQPTDVVSTIDFDKLANAAKLYYLVAHTIADTDAAPKHDVGQ